MNASNGNDADWEGSVDCIDALLPQIQCARCGYPSCREYAQALATGRADLNRCPPGGAMTIAALAQALHCDPKALDPACGEERPWFVARIDEAACIGCALCIQACPVDAILGAAKRMHTVLESECTGCELCLDPCPVDCIDLAPTSPGMDELGRSRQGLFPTIPCIPAVHGGQMPEPMKMPTTDVDARAQLNTKVADSFLERWMRERAPQARRRFQARQQRLVRLRRARADRRRPSPGMDEVGRSRMPEPTSPGMDEVGRSRMPEPTIRAAMPGRDADRATKQAVIRDAVNRARHRRRI